MTSVEKCEEYLIKNPTATAEKAKNDIGIGITTYYQAKRSLEAKGIIKSAKITNRGRPRGEVKVIGEDKNALLDSKSLAELFPDTPISEEMLNDDEVRQRLLRQIQKLAFDPNERPDIRLSATQVWVKLKDMAQQRDLGPGPPKDENAVIDRLARIMRAVGDALTYAALDVAFTQVNTDDEVANDKNSASSGTSEALNSA